MILGSPVTIEQVVRAKALQRRLSAVTCYDAAFGRFVEDSHIDIVLVGDSLGNVMLGHPDTTWVTLADMVHHTKAVARVVHRPLLVADMPMCTYGKVKSAVRNDGQLMQAGAQAVKLEGGRSIVPQVTALVRAGIPVIGHIGFTPQSVQKFGGPKVQGRTTEQAEELLKDAQALEAAGAFAVVLELVATSCASRITRTIGIPTIGIGAGMACDGQILVLHDLLGFNKERNPKFVKQYAHLWWLIDTALETYHRDVINGRFPDFHHSFMEDDTSKKKSESKK